MARIDTDRREAKSRKGKSDGDARSAFARVPPSRGRSFEASRRDKRASTGPTMLLYAGYAVDQILVESFRYGDLVRAKSKRKLLDTWLHYLLVKVKDD